MKALRKKKMDSRWLLGGLVVLAVVAVLAVKTLQPAPLAEAQPMEGPQAASVSADMDADDPWPSDAAEQIDWAMRHQVPIMLSFRSIDCIPCKAMAEVIDVVRGDYDQDIAFVTAITNDRTNMPLIQQAGVQAIPTTFFVTPSGEAKRFVGAMSEQALRAELDELQQGR